MERQSAVEDIDALLAEADPPGLQRADYLFGRRQVIFEVKSLDNAKNRPNYFPKVLYKGRARIEQTVGKLKRFKRVALRCKKTATSYSAIVAFACAMILVKSDHTA